MDLKEFNENQKQYLERYVSNIPDYWKRRGLEDYLGFLTEQYREELLSKIKKSKAILDVGCGFGNVLPDIIKNAPQDAVVVGVDIDEETAKHAVSSIKRGIIERRIPACSVMQASDKEGVPSRVWKTEKQPHRKLLVIYNTGAEFMLKCKENKFDILLSSKACRYFTDKIAALRRMLDVLKPEGNAYLLIDIDGILLLDEEPDVDLLHSAQDLLIRDEHITTTEAISKIFKGVDREVCDTYEFLRRYMDGLLLDKPIGSSDQDFLKIRKKGKISIKKKLPEYRSFLIGVHQQYKTVSVYVKQ